MIAPRALQLEQLLITMHDNGNITPSYSWLPVWYSRYITRKVEHKCGLNSDGTSS